MKWPVIKLESQNKVFKSQRSAEIYWTVKGVYVHIKKIPRSKKRQMQVTQVKDLKWVSQRKSQDWTFIQDLKWVCDKERT